ncbi:TPM domain-containing protein [Ideonella sp. 4Y16]|uniref:TPM domain-containing protein n=1 Tax=Ideonella alba TaxID=2824118 RepID=UPI001B37E550|nr:TPM domain-containing protein [Ideonella alba]MBQ0946114.1 TPM domain-containing protein [Ideonella alba]
MTHLLRWLLLAGWLLASGAFAQAPQPVPALSARVIDQTATLSTAQQQALEAKLAAFEAQSGPQIVILMVRSTAPEDIAAYAFRVADQWKIGRRGVGDGLLVLVAKDDRVARIEVARALEGAVPDLAARQVIDRAMVPAFRQGDYAGGLNLAVDQLIGRISGEGLPTPSAAPRVQGLNGLPALPSWIWWALLAVPLAISAVRAMFGPGAGALLMGGAGVAGGWWLAGLGVGLVAGLVLALVTALGVGEALRLVLSGAARGGFGGGGGGGFSSGGGGSFGGGGASGRW